MKNETEWGSEFLEPEMIATAYAGWTGWALVAGATPMVETDMVEGGSGG